jgi:hypothetical protein
MICRATVSLQLTVSQVVRSGWVDAGMGARHLSCSLTGAKVLAVCMSILLLFDVAVPSPCSWQHVVCPSLHVHVRAEHAGSGCVVF